MDHNDIRKIVELMDEHDLSYFHLEKDDFNLKLKKGLDSDAIQAAFAAMPAPVAAAPVAAAPVPAAPAAAAPAAEAAPAAADGEPFNSPMVGTFYRKPAPEEPNFCEVGDTVSEGQTICIIEAMKVMNEIKAETSGTISAIHVDDSTPVQFGDTLFTIK
ncbi:acetyl-CoA carboxylase biotin carboxyl carrier protein [Rubritalea marina]|uniref:acetyl-CoA carboxylase biotin carboxyl carrier protein n=1 Tax=Rubritalea marina TaxID=361055 RepID=UPI00036CA776|nr:acetyl-CoA carboxylase biotin carboxyl carrier protein [Rubritalea marina]